MSRDARALSGSTFYMSSLAPKAATARNAAQESWRLDAADLGVGAGVAFGLPVVGAEVGIGVTGSTNDKPATQRKHVQWKVRADRHLVCALQTGTCVW
jgi:hypothetical protein